MEKSQEDLYLFVIGHSLEAKCEIANAILNNIGCVRPSSCQRKKHVTKAQTIEGFKFNVVTTPNLNTPSWAHMQQELKFELKFKRTFFLYVHVKDSSSVDSNDAGSITKLRETFPSEGFPILEVVYDRVTTDRYSNETVKTVLFEKSTFQEKSERAKLILKEISKHIKCKQRTVTRSQFSRLSSNFHATVDDGRKTPQRSLSSVSIPRSASAVSVYDQISIDSLSPSCDLKDLTLKDCDCYRKALATGKARSNHVRVNVLGIQSTGKTTLVQRLQGVSVICPDKELKPTEGLEIHQIKLRCVEKNGQRCWERENEGMSSFEEELNVQRMALAMKTAQAELSQQDELLPACCAENKDEMSAGSDSVDNVVINRHGALNSLQQLDSQQKTSYVKRVLSHQESAEAEYMYFSFWDFAGQTAYYSNQQLFMSSSAVYLLVIDLSKELKDVPTSRCGAVHENRSEDTLKFLVASIKSYTRDEQGGNAPFIIVGTHLDKVSKEVALKRYKELRTLLQTQVEFISIDNTLKDFNDPNLLTLRNKLLDLGLGIRNKEIPAQWIDLEYKMIQMKKQESRIVVSMSDVFECDSTSSFPINQHLINDFLEYQHRTGLLMHFCHEDLNDMIILDLSKLANLFNVLLLNGDSDILPMNCDGIIDQSFIKNKITKVFGTIDQEQINKLTMLLKHLYIIHPFASDADKYFLPCLLPKQPDKDKKCTGKFHYVERAPRLRLNFRLSSVPPAFFHLLLSAMNEKLQLFTEESTTKPRIYSFYACFCFKKKTVWLEMYWEEEKIYFDLINFSTCEKLKDMECHSIIDLIEEKIKHILSIYSHGNVDYSLEVQCPRHSHSFLNLRELQEHNEVMCCISKDMKTSTHSVHVRVISDYYCNKHMPSNAVRPRILSNSDVNVVSPDINSKILCRLARFFTRENTNAFARLINLKNAVAKTDEVKNMSVHEPEIQRYFLLEKWLACTKEPDLEKLLKLLIKTKDYSKNDLRKIVQASVEYQNFGLKDDILNSIASEHELLIVSEHIGTAYVSLVIELGLTYQQLQQERADHPDHMHVVILNLLHKWVNDNPTTATVKELLNTAYFVGITTVQEIVKQIGKNKRK